MSNKDFENPHLIDEYLTSLQEQIDSLHARNARLQKEIANLKRERDARQHALPLWRRRGSRSTPEPDNQDRTVIIPGVGVIQDVELPDDRISRPDLVVAAVLDEFSRSGFRYEFDLRDIPATNPEEALEEASPAFLLVESAYRGIDASWAGHVARFGRPSPHLERLVDWCKAHDVPTVFWVKEDPINHDWFTSSASLFDVVLTVDANMLDSYRRRLGHSRIGVLTFAAQPAIHHKPVDSSRRPGRVAFAGSYYAAKHPERRDQMTIVLEPALEFDLHIFDRMDRHHDPRFAWPDIYQHHIMGSLTYPQTLEAYRRYGAFLNVNTVTDSPTMCSRRVYELLASGTRVISGPAAALSGVPVEITRSREQTQRLLERSPEHQPEERIEWVLANHTMSHRVEEILDHL